VIDRWRRTGATANVTLLETVDADGFFALLEERLARLP
jgi:inosine-uridine nucleoside N-ribohydrolase